MKGLERYTTQILPFKGVEKISLFHKTLKRKGVMPTVAPNNMNDVPRAERKKLEALFYERAMLKYSLSFEKIMDLLESVNDGKCTHDALRRELANCIVAWTDDEAKQLTADLNEKITAIYTENGIEKTLRHTDPFGRVKDFIMMEGVSTSFSKERALPIAVAGMFEWSCPKCDRKHFTQTDKNLKCENEKCANSKKPIAKVQCTKHSVSAEVFTAILTAATNTTRYFTLQARDVKEEK